RSRPSWSWRSSTITSRTSGSGTEPGSSAGVPTRTRDNAPWSSWHDREDPDAEGAQAPGRVSQETRLHPHGRAARRGAETRREAGLRDPEARREPSALRSAARAGRRHEELGRAEGPKPRPGRQAAGYAGGGSPDRVQRLRGNDSEG